MTSFTRLLRSTARTSLLLLTALPFAGAQRPASRISGDIASGTRSPLPGSRHPLALPADDTGAVDPSTPLPGITLHFSRTPAQQAALDQLLAAQQNPASSLYHQFLTPAQFGSTFGMSDADLTKATAWLQSQGFTVDSVAPSRNLLTFSGTAAQVESAFGSPIHNFTRNGATHFAPASDLSLPSALAGVTRSVANLSSFRPHPQARPAPRFTSGQSGNHFLTPGDISTIYDIKPAYNAGYTGAGQSIAVVGQSAILLSDIEHFQSASGITVHDPILTLIPNSGTSTVYPNDEGESDLDLEYSSSIAPGATIKFIYSGSNPNSSVTDALTYAITNNVAPIISMSYGQCEATLSAGSYSAENALLQQAAAQGQSIIVAVGDNGSSDCAENNMSGLYVDFPGSSQYVTGMGGTEFAGTDAAPGNNTYFQSNGTTDLISSALSYIPEVAWNDSDSSGISAGGGGISSLSPHPSWQTGVPGIPSSTFRLVPDIALDASSLTTNAPYLYCSSDTSTNITGSCSHGFRDVNNTNLTAVGGTSVGTPIFAGMLALINQAKGATSGQGLINPTLYTLASNSVTYATAFHDVTSGNNACVAGYRYCAPGATTSYSAGIGYDLATGLGSVDLYNLLTAWVTPAGSSTLLSSSTTISAASTSPAIGSADALTITVASASSNSTAVPSGTLSISVDGATVSSSLTLSSTGSATYTYTPTTSGTHTVTAIFSGNSVFAGSAGSITLTVPSSNTSSSTFSLAAPNISVSAGQTGTSLVTLTPAAGYTGTVNWSLSSTGNLSNACYTIAPLTVSGTAAVTTTLSIGTSASVCNTLSTLASRTPSVQFRRFGSGGSARLHTPSGPGSSGLIAVALCCSFSLAGLRVRRLRPLAVLLVAASASLAVSGCGSGSSVVASSNNAPTGSYTLTLTGADSTRSTITASTSLTLTIQ